MDTSTVASRADTLGRRVVPRNFRSLEEKQAILADARASGGSVAAIARKYGVNANLIFAWMRLEEQGLLQVELPLSNRTGRGLIAAADERPPKTGQLSL